MKAAVEQNIDEISSKMEERWRILYAIGDEDIRKTFYSNMLMTDCRQQVLSIKPICYM